MFLCNNAVSKIEIDNAYISKLYTSEEDQNKLIPTIKVEIITAFLTNSLIDLMRDKFNKFNFLIIENKLYFISGQNLCLYNFEDLKISKDIKLDPYEHLLGGLSYGYIEKELKIFITYRNILYILNKDLTLYEKYIHSKLIISLASIKDNYIYFVDVADALIKLNYNQMVTFEYLPEVIGDNLVKSLIKVSFWKNFIIYGGSLGHVYLVDKKNMSGSSIELNGDWHYHLFQNFIINENFLYASCDNYIFKIDLSKRTLVWKNEYLFNRIFFIHKDLLLISQNNQISFLNLEKGQIFQSIKTKDSIKNIFAHKNHLFFLTKKSLCSINMENFTYNNIFSFSFSLDSAEYNKDKLILKDEEENIYCYNIDFLSTKKAIALYRKNVKEGFNNNVYDKLFSLGNWLIKINNIIIKKYFI
jgi:hypothetical protein